MKKLSSLTGIRACAALWVIIYHLNLNFPQYTGVSFIDKGYLGVDMFFILSGFIISYVHQSEFLQFPSPKTLRFLILRCARILPVHYLMLFTYALFFLTKTLILHQPSDHLEQNTLFDFCCHLVNIQAWGLSDHNSWNAPAWSVSAEWFAYLMFPLITPVVGKIKNWGANLAIIAAGFAFLAGFSSILHLPTLDWTFQYALVRVSTEFLIGCSLFNLFQSGQENKNQIPNLSLVAFIGLMVCIGLQLPDVISVTFIALLLYTLTSEQGLLNRFLATKAMVYLGEVSYSIYMVHALFIGIVGQANKRLHFISAEPTLQNLLVFLAITLGIIGVAHCMYNFVEVPSRNLIRNRLIKEPKKKEVPTASGKVLALD